jgi:hypothetical protein
VRRCMVAMILGNTTPLAGLNRGITFRLISAADGS